MDNHVQLIIEKLDLKPHVEGGYFKRTYQSRVETNLNGRTRPINTAIYYLLESSDFACWHRLQSDELWHHYSGGTLIIYQLDDNGILTSTRLGNLLENNHAQPQLLIPANTWFASEVETLGTFALVGCTVAPGFDYEDFEMADRNNLLALYPQHEQIITKLTRK